MGMAPRCLAQMVHPFAFMQFSIYELSRCHATQAFNARQQLEILLLTTEVKVKTKDMVGKTGTALQLKRPLVFPF